MTGPPHGRVVRVLLAVLGFYQRAVSPALPPRCRFAPTCSAYAAEAIAVHGATRGAWLALRRLVKCGPWHPGGFDPVRPRRPGVGTETPGRSSGSGAPGTVPDAPDRSQRDPKTPPAARRSAQQEDRVA